jgi:SAM-dependent methyltransferase
VTFTLNLPTQYGKAWDAIPAVSREINRRISGHPSHDWVDLVASKYPRRRFERALFVNWTNGWLEHRLFLDPGIVETAVSIHERFLPMTEFNARYIGANASAVVGGISGAGEAGVWFNGVSHAPDLAVWGRDLGAAQTKWLELHGAMFSEAPPNQHAPAITIERRQITSADDFPEGPFDFVVNHCGASCLTHPDRVFRAIARNMRADGIMVSYDYIGPHRYQFSRDQWIRVRELNQELPRELRHDLVYPHLPTLLATDPTKGLHSELLLSTLRRYFTIDDFRPVGGAVAFPLLNDNEGLFGFAADLGRAVEEIVMPADWDYLCRQPNSSLFAFWTAQPNHAALRDRQALAAFTREEESRETAARHNGGFYYPPTQPHRVAYRADVWKGPGASTPPRTNVPMWRRIARTILSNRGKTPR